MTLRRKIDFKIFANWRQLVSSTFLNFTYHSINRINQTQSKHVLERTIERSPLLSLTTIMLINAAAFLFLVSLFLNQNFAEANTGACQSKSENCCQNSHGILVPSCCTPCKAYAHICGNCGESGGGGGGSGESYGHNAYEESCMPGYRRNLSRGNSEDCGDGYRHLDDEINRKLYCVHRHSSSLACSNAKSNCAHGKCAQFSLYRGPNMSAGYGYVGPNVPYRRSLQSDGKNTDDANTEPSETNFLIEWAASGLNSDCANGCKIRVYDADPPLCTDEILRPLSPFAGLDITYKTDEAGYTEGSEKFDLGTSLAELEGKVILFHDNDDGEINVANDACGIIQPYVAPGEYTEPEGTEEELGDDKEASDEAPTAATSAGTYGDLGLFAAVVTTVAAATAIC